MVDSSRYRSLLLTFAIDIMAEERSTIRHKWTRTRYIKANREKSASFLLPEATSIIYYSRGSWMSWDNMYKDPFAVGRIKKSVNLVIPFLSNNNTILDIGCFTQEAKKYLPSY